MGKTSKWLRNFLTGKKDRDREGERNPISNDQQPNSVPVPENRQPTTPISIPPMTPKEKRRWSFRRSSATAPSQTPPPPPATTQVVLEFENEQRKHAMVVAAATEAAVAAAQAAAAAVIQTSTGDTTDRGIEIEEDAAIKIQSAFRAHLARKALCALKGLVKLQALVRGHLVRKRATATIRCMQALLSVQARARAQRIVMAEELNPGNQRQSHYRKTIQDDRFRHTYEMDREMEENIKIVEMDLGDSKGSTRSRNSYSNHTQTEHRFSTQSAPKRSFSKQEYQEISPAPSAVTEVSPRACSGHFEDYSHSTVQSSPQYSSTSKPDLSGVPFAFPMPDYAEPLAYDYPLFPSYMANTESSRAKARSQSAPKSRPEEGFERQQSRRKPALEGRNVPRAVRMQRSSSHVGSAPQNYHNPWSIKLDRSVVSLKDSECGSSSTVYSKTNYCRSLVGFHVNGNVY